MSADPVQLFGGAALQDPVVKDILAVAMTEFAKFGLAGARVDAIAAQTKTSKRMIYYHFGSKEKLYEAVLEFAFRSIRRDGEAAEFDTMAPLAALRALAGHVFDIHADNPDFVHLVMQENLRDAFSLKNSATIPDVNAIGLALVQKLLARGQAAGVFRHDISALDLYTNMVGLSFHYVSNRQSFAANFRLDPNSTELLLARRKAIVDSVTRYVQLG